MLHNDILVMLMDDIFVYFFDDWLGDVGLHFSAKFMLLNHFAFIDIFMHCLFLMLDYNWLLVDFLHNGSSVVLL